MNSAMGECLGMASVSSGKPKMTIAAPSQSFKTIVNAEVRYNFVEDEDEEDNQEDAEKKEPEDDNIDLNQKEFEDKILENGEDDSDDSEDEKKNEAVRDDWVSVIYTVNIIMKEKEVEAADLRISFKMGTLKLIG
jgi:hypothetical protein